MPKLSFKLDPLFLVLAFGIGWLNSSTPLEIFLWALVIFISILVHELGHALTAIAFGHAARITFMPLGGLTSRAGPKLNSLREFIIVLNGPLAGIALYFLCRFLLQIHEFTSASSLGYMLLIGTYINLVWTVLNLFPILPLDGGKLVMILMEKIFGIKGGRIAYAISFITAALFALFFFVMQELFAGAIFSLFAFESYRGLSQGKHITAMDEDEEMKELLHKGISHYLKGDVEESNALFNQIRERAKAGLIYLQATLFLSKSLEMQQEFKQAYSILKPEEKKLDIEGLETLQRLAFKSGDFKSAARMGAEVFQERPSPDTAFINALSLSQLKEVTPAVGWFETAVREGLENPQLSSRHLAFDPIRDTDAFKNLLKHY